jgi:hypothetical protein
MTRGDSGRPVKPMWVAGCVGIFATLCLAVGCTTEAVGQTCSTERDCPDGTRCYRPDGSAVAVCTVRCDETPCSEGQCQQTDRGSLCLKQCRSQRDCGEETRCQRGDHSRVCWPVNDSHISEVPQGPMIDGVEIWSTKTDSWRFRYPDKLVSSLSPGETYVVDAFVVNNGYSGEYIWLSEASIKGACIKTLNRVSGSVNDEVYRIFSPSESCDSHLGGFDQPTSNYSPKLWEVKPGDEVRNGHTYDYTLRPLATMLIEMPAETSASEVVVTLGIGRVGSSGTVWSSSIGLEVKKP